MKWNNPIAWLLVGVFLLLLVTPGLASEIGVSKELTYEDAKKSLTLGDYMSAIEMFSQLGTYEDSKDYVIYAWALLYLEREEFSDAIQRFDILAKSKFLDCDQYILYANGRNAEAQGDTQDAITYYGGLGFLDSNERLLNLTLTTPALPPSAPVPESPTPPAPTPFADGVHVFVDRAMGEAIRKKLGKPSGADVYLSELAEMESLERKYTEGKGIKSLQDLQHCAGLRVLFIEDNPGVSDLTPLKNLMQLRRLWIQKNSISDLSPLAGLVGLTELGICHNQVDDLSPLAGMKDMSGLYLNSNTRISDLSPLDDMASLTFFQYGNNKLSTAEIANFKALHPSCKLIAKKK